MTDRIEIDLTTRKARASFVSGVIYEIEPYLYAQKGVKTPENAAKVLFRETINGQIIRLAEYKDLAEASYDSELPSVAKYLLQGLIGVPI